MFSFTDREGYKVTFIQNTWLYKTACVCGKICASNSKRKNWKKLENTKTTQIQRINRTIASWYRSFVQYSNRWRKMYLKYNSIVESSKRTPKRSNMGMWNESIFISQLRQNMKKMGIFDARPGKISNKDCAQWYLITTKW